MQEWHGVLACAPGLRQAMGLPLRGASLDAQLPQGISACHIRARNCKAPDQWHRSLARVWKVHVPDWRSRMMRKTPQHTLMLAMLLIAYNETRGLRSPGKQAVSQNTWGGPQHPTWLRPCPEADRL